MIDPKLSTRLVEARIAAHHAVQVPSALAATHLVADEAHRYANLSWKEGLRALVGRPVHGVCAGLELAAFRWILVVDEAIVASRACAGSTLEQGLSWLCEVAAAHGVEGRVLRPVGYDLPDHPTDGGALPPVDPAHLRQLDAWYATAAAALDDVRARNAGASAVRLWPHHFDIATLITLDEGDAERARSVGLGMTPGDGGIPEPYLYVTPWPYPEERRGPELSRGRWNTEGWFGAVLRGSELSEDPAFAGFLVEALEACRDLLGAEPEVDRADRSRQIERGPG